MLRVDGACCREDPSKAIPPGDLSLTYRLDLARRVRITPHKQLLGGLLYSSRQPLLERRLHEWQDTCQNNAEIRRRHPWHLNERFIFVTLGNTLLFLGLGIRDILSGHLLAVWPSKRVSLVALLPEMRS